MLTAWTTQAGAQSEETVPEGEITTVVDGATTSILATTTTTPPDCKELVAPTVVFVGTVTGTSGVMARYAVAQVRSGELGATRVQVEYPDDIRFVKDGRQYVVGAWLDPATNQLVSKVRPPRDVDPDDPCIDQDQVYTRNLDGTPVDTGLLSGLSGKGWQIAWAFLLPTLIALGLLTVLVLFRRAGAGAFRLSLRGAARPPQPSPPPDEEPPVRSPPTSAPQSRTPAPRDTPARR